MDTFSSPVFKGRIGISIDSSPFATIPNNVTDEGRASIVRTLVGDIPPQLWYFVLLTSGWAVNRTRDYAQMPNWTEFTQYEAGTRPLAQYVSSSPGGTGTLRNPLLSGETTPSTLVTTGAATIQYIALVNGGTKGQSDDPSGLLLAYASVGQSLLSGQVVQIYHQLQIGLAA